MKRTLFLFSGLLPGFAFATSSGMLLASAGNIPDDFKSYFFQSEIPVQVYLNDKPLFEAAMRMREDGGITLASIIASDETLSPETQDRWEVLLRKGIETGRCERDCTQGLISADYNLGNSTLRLMTAQYEKERVRGDYVELPEHFPAGLIINNDFSALRSSSSNQHMSLSSGWTASLAGWSHNMSFQSTHVSGQYGYDRSDLYNLYSQKELAGQFIRVGFFTPDDDSGNVQTSSFGYDTIVGAMWGTSDILLQSNESVSAWPVYVTGRNQSIAEIWRDGRLIHTQQLQDGLQALDTRRLPGGIYDISIRILENGQLIDTQTAQIYKPNSWRDTSRHWRANLWAGQQRAISSGHQDYEEGNAALGGSLDLLAWAGGIMGVSASVQENEDYWLRVRSDISLTNNESLFAQHTRTSSNLRTYSGTDVRYYRNIQSGISGSVYWRNTYTESQMLGQHKWKSDIWGSSLSISLDQGARLTSQLEYKKNDRQRGLDADLSLSTRHNWFSRDADLRISGYDRTGYRSGDRDRGAAISLSMSLFPSDSRHTISAAVGVNNGDAYSNANYQWSPDNESAISWLGGGVSRSSSMTTFNGNGAIDTRYLNGDGFIQHASSSDNTAAGINLNQTLAIGEWKIASSRDLNGQDAVMIVDLVQQDDGNIIASGSMAEQPLRPGRNVVPVNLWQRDTLQFSSVDSSASVKPERISMQMNRGSVGYVKVSSVKMRTIVAVPRDRNGNILPGSVVTAGTDKGFVNDEGILTMDIPENIRAISVSVPSAQDQLHCALDTQDKGSDREEIHYMNDIRCR